MVKLQKILAYKYKTKSGEINEHYKFMVNIPEQIILELAWKEGSELKLMTARGALTIQGKTNK